MSESKDKNQVKFDLESQGEGPKSEAEAEQSQENIPYWERDGEFHLNVESAFHLSCGRENIKAIVAIEQTGGLVRKLADKKPACPIVAVVNDRQLAADLRQLDGVMTLLFDGDLFTPDWRMVDDFEKLDDRVAAAGNLLKLQGIAADGDEVVVVTGPRPQCFTGASITCPVAI